MSRMNMIQAINSALDNMLDRDPNVLIFGEDVGYFGGVFRCTAGLQEKYGAKRCFDTPIAEGGILGMAIGMGANGLRPVAEIQFADYIYPAFDQLVSEAARLRYRSAGEFSAPLTVRAPCGGGIYGGQTHSQSPESLFTHASGIKTVIPATPYDAKGLLASAIRSDDPVIVLEHKRTYRLVKGEVPIEDYTIPIGRAEIKRPGSEMTIVTYGLMLHYALQAAETVSEQGLDVEVLDLRTLRPLDADAIAESVSRTGKVLIVQEDTPAVSISSEVAAIVGERCFFDLDGPIPRLTAPELPPMPFSPLQEAAFMPSPEKIVAAIAKLAEL